MFVPRLYRTMDAVRGLLWRIGLARDSWGFSRTEIRASFEVVDVSSLPSVDRPDIPVVLARDRPCGCYWCDADWLKIAAASVEILEAGVDPLNQDAVAVRGSALGLEAEDIVWLLSLFSPTHAIIHLRDCGQFTDGMHRTHALRMAGIERVVVYTGKGETTSTE